MSTATYRNWLLILCIAGAGALLFNWGAFLLLAPLAGLASTAIGALYALLVLALLRLPVLRPLWPHSASKLWIWAALVWGSGTSFLGAMIGGPGAVRLTEHLGFPDAALSLGGAWPEEIAKTLGVLFILGAFAAMRSPWHGLIVGAVIGLGFEVIENIQYATMGATLHYSSDWTGLLETWSARTVYGPGIHVVLSALAGWGVGLAFFNRRLLAGLGWWALAFVLHFSWNYLHESLVVLVIKGAVTLAVMYGALVLAVRQARRLEQEQRAPVHHIIVPRTVP